MPPSISQPILRLHPRRPTSWRCSRTTAILNHCGTRPPLASRPRPTTYQTYQQPSSTRGTQQRRYFSSNRDSSHNIVPVAPSPSPSPSPLAGTTCMVTGGGSGIGLAIARRFLREGVEKVVLVGRSRERLERAVRSLQEDPIVGDDAVGGLYQESSNGVGEGEGVNIFDPPRKAPRPLRDVEFDNVVHDQPHDDDGDGVGRRECDSGCEIVQVEPRFTLVIGDVGKPEFWAGKDIARVMSTIHTLINSAGTTHSSLLPLTPDSSITTTLHTNLQGTILACRAMTRRVLRQRTATTTTLTKSIINISSLHATKGGVGAAVYASSKAGVIALTRAIVAEGNQEGGRGWGRGLRANVIVPGYVETGMVGDMNAQVREKALQAIPLGRFGRVEEVADAAVFLARNEYANNCVLNLDGGLSAM
ncbi:hypothetical protein FQN51_000847 [Onygenales sp. PD_10]|nr:hypothetical protein FQN51_000847 [Onygenales sp. PD_10]